MDAVGFLAAIRVHFPVRHESEQHEKDWWESYTSELRGFSSQELERAGAQIKRTRNLNGREGRFPSLAECLAECKEARRLFDAQKRAETLPGLRDEEADLTDDERLMRIYGPGRVQLVWGTLMKTAMAKQAAREGWIGMLAPYCFQHGRLPDPKEVVEVRDRHGRLTGQRMLVIPWMKKEARDIDDWHGDGKPASRVVAKVKIIILEKRERLATRVLEGKA